MGNETAAPPFPAILAAEATCPQLTFLLFFTDSAFPCGKRIIAITAA